MTRHGDFPLLPLAACLALAMLPAAAADADAGWIPGPPIDLPDPLGDVRMRDPPYSEPPLGMGDSADVLRVWVGTDPEDPSRFFVRFTVVDIDTSIFRFYPPEAEAAVLLFQLSYYVDVDVPGHGVLVIQAWCCNPDWRAIIGRPEGGAYLLEMEPILDARNHTLTMPVPWTLHGDEPVDSMTLQRVAAFAGYPWPTGWIDEVEWAGTLTLERRVPAPPHGGGGAPSDGTGASPSRATAASGAWAVALVVWIALTLRRGPVRPKARLFGE